MSVDAAWAVPVGISLWKVIPGQAQAGHVEAARAGVAQQQWRSLRMVHLQPNVFSSMVIRHRGSGPAELNMPL